MDGFEVELLRRLPLAQAALRVFGYSLDSAMLGKVFEQHRGRCYQDVLTFEKLVYLVLDALTVHAGSGHQAFTRAAVAGNLPVAEQNVYGKLARMPEALSTALLSAGAARLRDVLPFGQEAVALPACLSGWRVIAFDGKKIKNAAKRLKPLRGLPGKLLGGKLLVALDVSSALVIAMNADPDGERNDVPLVPNLVEQVRVLIDMPILWIADRQFGNLEVPAVLAARASDRFLVRCPKSLRLFVDSQRPAESQIDEKGRLVVQEWGWIGLESDSRRRYVRRITLHRPDEEAIILITNLIEAQRYPAADLLATYLQRWGIERVFQEVTEVFHLETLIGSTPWAMIFQSALCFLLYDMIQVIRAYLAQDSERAVAEVSGEKLFWDVQDQLTTWKNMGRPEVAVAALAFGDEEGAATPTAMRSWLSQTLANCWKQSYRKAPPKKRATAPTPAHAKVPIGHGGHTSTWRVLQAATSRQGSG
jgi:hypothetical protein